MQGGREQQRLVHIRGSKALSHGRILSPYTLWESCYVWCFCRIYSRQTPSGLEFGLGSEQVFMRSPFGTTSCLRHGGLLNQASLTLCFLRQHSGLVNVNGLTVQTLSALALLFSPSYMASILLSELTPGHRQPTSFSLETQRKYLNLRLGLSTHTRLSSMGKRPFRNRYQSAGHRHHDCGARQSCTAPIAP